MTDIHLYTEACGFDRNASIAAGHYVCLCGHEDIEPKQTNADGQVSPNAGENERPSRSIPATEPAPSAPLPLTREEINRVANRGVLHIAGTLEQLSVWPFCDMALLAHDQRAEIERLKHDIARYIQINAGLETELSEWERPIADAEELCNGSVEEMTDGIRKLAAQLRAANERLKEKK